MNRFIATYVNKNVITVLPLLVNEANSLIVTFSPFNNVVKMSDSVKPFDNYPINKKKKGFVIGSVRLLLLPVRSNTRLCGLTCALCHESGALFASRVTIFTAVLILMSY